jgi:hypothetical protein
LDYNVLATTKDSRTGKNNKSDKVDDDRTFSARFQKSRVGNFLCENNYEYIII